MENIAQKALLFDFYGELLTEHQRNVYEEAVCNDMSLSEIAEEFEISRQGVHDLLKRCDKILMDYESKLHLVEHFQTIKKRAETIAELSELSLILLDKKTETVEENLHEIARLSGDIVDEL